MYVTSSRSMSYSTKRAYVDTIIRLLTKYDKLTIHDMAMFFKKYGNARVNGSMHRVRAIVREMAKKGELNVAYINGRPNEYSLGSI